MKDMTKGNPFKVIIAFTMPMLLSVVFQQFYNIADSIIAGNFIGVDALAAVGASYPITILFLAVATGSSVGCSVVISQIFGAKEYVKMKTAISTAIISLVTLSIILTIIGMVFSNSLMHMINTPSDIFKDSELYLQVYVYGVVFLFIYNTATAIFNALGDSKTPLYFLIFSSLFNIALDMLFVIVLKMGVAGVAWATFVAQGLSSLLAMGTLIFRLRKIKTDEPHKKFDLLMLKQISRVAIPSIMQQSFVSVGQLFVQGLVNNLGSIHVAGYAAAFKINMFGITSMNTMSAALSSFVAQNYGARKLDRVTKGFKSGLIMALSFCAIIVACIFGFGNQLIGLFVKASENPEVVAVGKQFLWIAAPFYFVIVVKIMCDGVLRGAGDMREFMVTTFADLVLRVLFSFATAGFLYFAGICWAYPFGWVIACAMSVYFYLKGNWKKPTELR